MSTLRGQYFFLLIALLFAAGTKAQTRIMPLGNSITEGVGSSHHGGYRRDLYFLLQNAGLAFDFVGSQRYGNGFPDPDHEGHPGFPADQLTVPDYLANHPAEAVFLEIGTNDISYGESATRVRDAIRRIVDNIYLINQDIAIYLSTVVPRKDSNALQQTTDALNALLPDLVRAKSAAGCKIYLVDIAARFKADPNWKTNLLADHLHPSDAGYALMANEWHNAYRLHLQPSDVIMADDFNGGALDENKWRRGSNGGNLTRVSGNRLELKANGAESGWVITRQAYPARNTTATVRVVQPNGDGDLGMSSTYNLASPFGIYDQPNWYRFYTYRNGNSGPYRLFVAWKKNGVDGGFDVTGKLAISGAVYLRLRCDHSLIYFEASFDGATWMEAWRETFALPGHTLDAKFFYELSGYYTSFKGNLVIDDFAIAAVRTGADTQPPQISAIAAQNLTTNSARIIWQTNELADSQVEYGLTTNYGALSPLVPALSAAHAVTLAALPANTTWHYRVKSRDAAGNLAVSSDFAFTTLAPAATIFADAFNAGHLDGGKWQSGANRGNQAAVKNKALELKSQNGESSWVATRKAYVAQNTTVTVKVIKPNNDGTLGVSPTIDLSSKHGIYDQANWYRFYTYRNANTGPYRLYVGRKKNGAESNLEVTGNLVIVPQSGIYIRLRFDNSRIHFEASLDGVNWTTTYAETFDLPGYTLNTPFYYELAAYKTGVNGIRTVDDFSISYNASSNLARESMASEAMVEPIPTAFTLQNYPNPFSASGTFGNAATRIRFALPQAAEIEVKIFDLAGRELSELASGSRLAGNHEVIWNGRGRGGEALSSGTYLVRLRYRSEKNGAWSQLRQRVMLVK